MTKFLTLLLTLLTGATTLIAQPKPKGPVLKFDNTHHEFGDMKEELGSVKHTYKFRNEGDRNLILTEVHPSCGCTLAKYTKDSVAPGKEGVIEISFDLANKRGRQQKSITVKSNAPEQSVMLLSFAGTIVERPRTWKDTFTHKLGNLYFDNQAANFDIVKNNVKDTAVPLYIYNGGTAPITITGIKMMKDASTAKYIFAKDLPFVIKPATRERFYIHYAADQADNYGVTFDQVRLVTNDAEMPEKTMTIFADIRQYVQPYPESQKANAPKAFVMNSLHDFGDIKQGEDVTTEFTVTNKGKDELVIYKVKPSCGCTAAQLDKSRLKKGESAKIQVTFHSAGMTGPEAKQVKVITNDPENTEIQLTIKSNVIAAQPSGQR